MILAHSIVNQIIGQFSFKRIKIKTKIKHQLNRKKNKKAGKHYISTIYRCNLKSRDIWVQIFKATYFRVQKV